MNPPLTVYSRLMNVQTRSLAGLIAFAVVACCATGNGTAAGTDTTAAGVAVVAEDAAAVAIADTAAAAAAVAAATPAAPEPDSSRSVPHTRLKAGWHTPDEILLAPSPTAPGTFEYLAARFSSERILGAAEKKAARWLQVDEVDLDGQRVLLRKEYGDRFEVATFAGIGPWAESGVLAEYRLYKGWVLGSETRERGESHLEIRRVFTLP